MWDKHGSLCYFNASNCRSLFSTCFSQRFSLPTSAMLGTGPYTTTMLVPVSDREKKPLKQYGAVSMCQRVHSSRQSTFNFFDSLVIFRHNFTGNGKVSCILPTISVIEPWAIRRISQIPVNTCVRSHVPKYTQKSLWEWSPPSWIRTKAKKRVNPPHTADSKSCQYGDKAPLKPHMSRGGGWVVVYFVWWISL